MAISKDDLHRLVDSLPEQETTAAKRFLEFLLHANEPMINVLDRVEEDDEELEANELLALEEADQDIFNGRTYSFEEVQKGLSI